MLTFLAAAFFLIITPGPGVLTTAGIGAAYGYQSGFRFLIGLWAGTNFVSIAVVTGLAAIVLSIEWLRNILLLASLGYLAWMAIRIAMAGSKVSFIDARRDPGIMDGVVLQVINPKAYAVSTTLFSGFAFMPDSLLGETLIKFAIMNLLWVPVHFIWLAAGVNLKRLALAEKTQRIINVLMGVSMMLVVILALLALLTPQ
jgi:threonine/homoserine/homoserine lactone efflux protein